MNNQLQGLTKLPDGRSGALLDENLIVFDDENKKITMDLLWVGKKEYDYSSFTGFELNLLARDAVGNITNTIDLRNTIEETTTLKSLIEKYGLKKARRLDVYLELYFMVDNEKIEEEYVVVQKAKTWLIPKRFDQDIVASKFVEEKLNEVLKENQTSIK